MTERFSEQLNNFDEHNPLEQLIERLKPLHSILSQNSYVKDTTTRLKRIIDDADSQPIVLFIGKERVGKTTVINSLIGRNLLEDRPSEPTRTNTFLKYGDEEYIKAVFLNGMEVIFDIANLSLFTISNSESAQIIRKHLDYLEVYITCELLKKVTIVDSVALETGANNTAFFSPALLQRCDEVFWVLQAGSPATEAEVNFIEQLNKMGITAHLVVNGIDRVDGEVEAFLGVEKERYGYYIGEDVPVSALQAQEARKTNSTQLLIDSRITQLSQLMFQLIDNKQKKTRHTTERFLQWLERLRVEMNTIPAREPYVSAFEYIVQHQGNLHIDAAQLQQDKALITSFEKQYETVSKVFKEVQTLFQLLQILESYSYLHDPVVDMYEETAALYQKNVRDYRKLHVDYMMEYGQLEKLFKKQTGMSLAFPLEESELSSIMSEQIQTLNRIRTECEQKLMSIKKYEQFILEKLDSVQARLNDLTKKQLTTIRNQVKELEAQQIRKRSKMISYTNKLAEFSCMVEAQSFLKDAIEPFLLERVLPIKKQEEAYIRQTVEHIMTVDYSYEAPAVADSGELLALLNLKEKYPLFELRLSVEDIVSDIPELPGIIEI
ncbi:Dynamin family protein [Solibacillus isronensis B3W22]|uniref:Dynamin family protein n=1 Tax=Solibacillus isronensis B3W22 TaxID=1224748 RepID=K1KKC8_9BACL|nr:dynamin family protein [Solibacillus isronensis]AMO85435.1 GTPase [Solibacillus silvestris]EKB44530.1 Dynamin family protein [Solibacillus isronensis B3W22]